MTDADLQAIYEGWNDSEDGIIGLLRAVRDQSISEYRLAASAPTRDADARPVADAREALTDSVVEGWLDRQGNDSGQGLCDMYTSAVRDGYRLARSTLTDFYATRDAAPSDAKRLEWLLHVVSGKELRRIGVDLGDRDPVRSRIAIDMAIAAIAPREET